MNQNKTTTTMNQTRTRTTLMANWRSLFSWHRALLLVAAAAATALLVLQATTTSSRPAQSVGVPYENHTTVTKTTTIGNNASIKPSSRRQRTEEALEQRAADDEVRRADYRSLQQSDNEDSVVLRINCGSDLETYVDTESRVWNSDQYFTNGQSGSTQPGDSVIDTDNDWPAFQTYRAEGGVWLGLIPNGRTLLYTLPVSKAGTYEVTLYFTSNKDNTPNSLLFWFLSLFGATTYFDVKAGGSKVFSSKDLPSPEEANPQNGGVTMSLRQTANSNKEIQLEFIPHGRDAYVSAIELRSQNFASVIPPNPAPVMPPVPAPVMPPVPAPVASPTQPTVSFDTILINAGGDAVNDFLGRKWLGDQYFSGGKTFSDARFDIKGSQDDYLYHTERFGVFSYEIPIPEGDYEIILHFAELYWESQGSRLFNVAVEGKPVFSNIDIVQLAGSDLKAVTLETPQTISDGFVSISVTNSAPQKVDNPKLSAIEIKLVEDHLAHAVANGPYSRIDSNGDGVETIQVDGTLSHTHGPGLVLVEYIWKTGSTVLGTGETTSLTLPVGEHTVTLTVTDSGGNQSTEATTISVLSGAYPSVSGLSPDSGPVGGGNEVTIAGSGFTSLASETTVMFGQNAVTGSAITIENENTIKVKAPAASQGIPVDVSVKTKVGTSNKKLYTYVGTSKIEFEEKYLKWFEKPTVVRFGPNGKLYVGNTIGQLGVFTVDDNLDLNDQVISTVSQWRAIMGIAFDPLDTSDNPDVYFSNADFYHGEEKSSSGNAINGKISKASGANLDSVVDVIVGLPVSDSDHSINAIEFGDKGELYIQIGGNTNGGIPGQLSGSQKLKDNVLGGATLVAYLSDPGFDGVITYDRDDDGNQVGAKGSVEVYAPGMRNPYGIVLHSNGKLYGTDNGPNVGYGDMKKSCNGQQVGDIEEDDKINLIVKDGYYGHPNSKRAESDSRQCVWRSFNDQSDGSYNAPLLKVPSSTNGIVEFKSDAFGGQLRGNLIVSKYKSALYRVILTNGGTATSTEEMNPTKLAGGSGLDVTQAPDGSLIEARYDDMALYGYTPKEAGTSSVVVKSVWPYRGGQAGGSMLTVYGKNMKKDGANPSVTVGGGYCAVQWASNDKLQCTLPGGSGTVDVAVDVNGESYTFKSGYRYITGY